MFKRILSLFVIICFFLTSLGPLPKAHADTGLALPAAGTMIDLSPAYEPVMIKGMTVHKDNPFLFDFIVDVGQDKISGEPLKKEGEKLIKYFLASLAIPDKDVWVNLSPYEKDRIVPETLGQTDMGRDLLEQDYILKQITASLIYPEKQLGKSFWNRVYAQAQEKFGTTQIPVNTFNKVWIMADRAEVFEHNQTAFVVDSHLKVMLEEDYLSLQKHSERTTNDTHSITSNIIRQIVLPELEKEVNAGKNFAPLRQIFNSIILAGWYKRSLKQALLNQVYSNKNKVNGVTASGASQDRKEIYEQYLKAYKKGVFNYIKEDINAANGQEMPRKYFSGGIDGSKAMMANITRSPSRVIGILSRVAALVIFLTNFLSPAASPAALPNQGAVPALSAADAAMANQQFIDIQINKLQRYYDHDEIKWTKKIPKIPENQRRVYDSIEPTQRKLSELLTLIDQKPSLFAARDKILQAIELVFDHQGPIIRNDVTLYPMHPLQVALNFINNYGLIDNPDLILAAILHDFIEDVVNKKEYTGDRRILENLFGSDVQKYVDALTNKDLSDKEKAWLRDYIIKKAGIDPVTNADALEAVYTNIEYQVGIVRKIVDNRETLLLKSGDFDDNALNQGNLSGNQDLQSRLSTKYRDLIRIFSQAFINQAELEEAKEASANSKLAAGLRKRARVYEEAYLEVAGYAEHWKYAQQTDKLVETFDQDFGGLKGLSDEIASHDEAMVSRVPELKPYQDIESMYQSLPTDIVKLMTSIAERNGFADSFTFEDKEHVLDLIRKIGEFYGRMHLKTENYHNHLHNMYVTFGSLLIASNARLLKDKEELISMFLAGLFHDFHMREVRPEGSQSATPAYVHETLGRPGTTEGGQLLDLLNINGFEYTKSAIPNARYKEIITASDKTEVRDIVSKLAQGLNLEKIHIEMMAEIRRTDFPSDVPPPATTKVKLDAQDIRDMMDSEALSWSNDREDLEGLISKVHEAYQGIYGNIAQSKIAESSRTADSNWVRRQEEIDLNFLEALKKVSPQRRARVYQLANRLELADQSGSFWIGSSDITNYITLGLKKELSFVSIESNKPFFLNPQLLNDRILARLKGLPLNYRINFFNNVEYSARLTRDFVAGLAPEARAKLPEVMVKDWELWDNLDRERALMGLGLYVDWDGQIKAQEVNSETMRALRQSIFGKVFNLTEIYHMVKNRMLTPQTIDRNNSIIEENSTSKDMYIIVSGTVHIVADEGVKRTLTPGVDGHFGELAILGNTKRNATVTAGSAGAVILQIAGQDINGLRYSDPDFNDYLLRLAPGRLSRRTQSNPSPFLIKSNIMMTVSRGKDQSWQKPVVEAGQANLTDEEHSGLVQALDKIQEDLPVRMGNVKTVTIVSAPLDPVKPVQIYPNPIDGSEVLVVPIGVVKDEGFDQKVDSINSAFGINAAMVTMSTHASLAEIAGKIGLQRIIYLKVDGNLVDFSDPSWKSRRNGHKVKFEYDYFSLTGNSLKDADKVYEEINELLQRGRLNDAIRLFTLNRHLFVGERKSLGWAISAELIRRYKGDFRLVGKMGGTEIQWALAVPAGIVTPIVSQPTHLYEGNRPEVDVLAQDPRNSLDEIMKRIVTPMKELAELYGVGYGRIRDYYFSAPGFFGPEDENGAPLVEPQKNIANMPAGFRFDVAIPEFLKAKTGDQLIIKGRTVHDGTGHAFGDKSVYGPFSLEDTIYGFWVGTGIASRVSRAGLDAFTGDVELNYLHNEGPHQALWNVDTKRYDVVFDITKGRSPDRKPGARYFMRESLEDRTKGAALANAFLSEYEKLLQKDPTNKDVLEVQGFMGDRKFDYQGLKYLELQKPALLVRVFQARAHELGLGIGALLWYLVDHHWQDGTAFDLKTIKIPLGGMIAQLNSLGLFDKVKEGILAELRQHEVSDADLELVSQNIMMSPINEDLRELLGGLPSKEFENASYAMITAKRRPAEVSVEDWKRVFKLSLIGYKSYNKLKRPLFNALVSFIDAKTAKQIFSALIRIRENFNRTPAGYIIHDDLVFSTVWRMFKYNKSLKTGDPVADFLKVVFQDMAKGINKDPQFPLPRKAKKNIIEILNQDYTGDILGQILTSDNVDTEDLNALKPYVPNAAMSVEAPEASATSKKSGVSLEDLIQDLKVERFFNGGGAWEVNFNGAPLDMNGLKETGYERLAQALSRASRNDLSARFSFTVGGTQLTKIVNITRDAAMPGGINLDTSSGSTQWKVSKDGKGVEMGIDPAMIARFRREGLGSLSPFVISVTPLSSIWPLVGLQAPAQAEKLARA